MVRQSKRRTFAVVRQSKRHAFSAARQSKRRPFAMVRHSNRCAFGAARQSKRRPFAMVRHSKRCAFGAARQSKRRAPWSRAAGTECSVTARGKLGSLLRCQARSAEELGGVGAHCSGTCPPWDISSKGQNIPGKNGRGRYILGPLCRGIVFISQICMKANIDQSILLLLLLKGKSVFID